MVRRRPHLILNLIDNERNEEHECGVFICCFPLKHAPCIRQRVESKRGHIDKCDKTVEVVSGCNSNLSDVTSDSMENVRFVRCTIIALMRVYVDLSKIGNGRKSVFRNLFGRFHFVSGTLWHSHQFQYHHAFGLFAFFLHIFESHVIYCLHFHAYMKHVVPLAAEEEARASATTSKNYYTHFPHAFPATLRYQSVSSIVYVHLYTFSNGNNFASIKLHRC